MTVDSAIQFLTGLSHQEKAFFLAKLALELTVAARSTYVAGTEEVETPRRLRLFNELQHRVLGNEVGLLGGDPCYPDDLLVRMIYADDEIRHECDWAFSKAAESVSREMPAKTGS